MAQSQRLTELARQKELLIAEAELRRCLLSADCQRLAQPVRWVQQLPERLGPWRHLLPIAAPIAGLFLARGGGSAAARWAGRAFTGFKIARQVMKMLSSKEP